MRKASPPSQRDSSLLGSNVFIFQHVLYLAVIWDINKTATPDPGCAANVQIDTFEFLFWRAENNDWVCVQVGLPSERCSYTSQSNYLQLYASLPDSFSDFIYLLMVTHGHPRLQDSRSAALRLHGVSREHLYRQDINTFDLISHKFPFPTRTLASTESYLQLIFLVIRRVLMVVESGKTQNRARSWK